MTGYLSAGALALAEEAMAGMVGLKAKLAVMVLAVGLSLVMLGFGGFGGSLGGFVFAAD